jgi:hypothetical protein
VADPTTQRQWLIVVRRGKPDVYENLRQSFEHDAGVRVVVDRRRTDRRTGRDLGEVERRRQERRQSLPAAEATFGQRAGFFLIVGRDLPEPATQPRSVS